MSRLPDPTQHLQGQDLTLFQEMCAKRGEIHGMYRSLMNHPELTRHVADLGGYLRFTATLEGKIREFIILSCAHHYGAEYEWVMHIPPAEKAGLEQSVIDALKHSKPLPEPYRTLHTAIHHVFKLENIPAPLQETLIHRMTMKGLIELVILVGFYRMIAGVITSFDVPLPGAP